MPKNSKNPVDRRPGRPALDNQMDSRAALIEAAKELLSQQAFDAVSNRRIAERAGVNPAMIHYHFKDRAGLHVALLRESIAPVIKRITELPTDTASTEPALARFLKLYMETLAANPWLPRMIVREVLSDSGHLRDLFIEEFGSHLATSVSAMVQQGKVRGELRADVDPVLTTLSIASLAVFPFLGLPLTSQAIGYTMDEDFVRRLIEHTVNLVYQGAGGGES